MAGKSSFCELSTEEIQELMENAVPTTTKKATNFVMTLFYGTYSKFSYKSKKCNSSVRRDFKHL